MPANSPLIWDGSPGPISGSTPMGYFDNDLAFQQDGPKIANWVARKLGYPILDVELVSGSIYACFEDAITAYSIEVNFHNITDNLGDLIGSDGSVNLSQREITSTLQPVIRLSGQYGTEAVEEPMGGYVDVHTGSIQITQNKTIYDLKSDPTSTISGSSAYDIEIKKIYHYDTPAGERSDIGLYGMSPFDYANEFNWNSSYFATEYVLAPQYDEVLASHAIELSDQIYKSSYGFKLANNKLEITPIPESNFTLFFRYIKASERGNVLKNTNTSSISDISNAKYDRIPYARINDPGKDWIRDFTLAGAKELLGMIRSKEESVQFNDNISISLDGQTLRQEGAAEKEQLRQSLRERLEKVSKRAMLESKREQTENTESILGSVPMPFYIM